WLNKHGQGEPSLYVNQGDGTFVDVAATAGVDLAPGLDPHGAAWADVDRDGRQDLLQLVDAGTRPANALYRNLGDGTFEEIAARVGVDLPGGHGRMPLWADLDRDGRLDLVHTSTVRANDPQPFLRFLRQREDGTFEDVTEPLGVSARFANFATLADLDGDEVADLLVDADDVFPGLALQTGAGFLTELALN
ncbi:MAG: VCBS repeat-containing protein, partial [Pseudomonadota bacterium]